MATAMIVMVEEEEATPLTTIVLTRALTMTMRLPLTGVVCEISAITHILNNNIWDSFVNLKTVLIDSFN